MKKLLSSLLAFAVILSLLLLSYATASASDANIVSGQITDNAAYCFDKNSGELTVDGYGMIWTGRVLSENLYSKSVKSEDIKKLIIKDGITVLDLNMFFFPYDEAVKLSEITLPVSIRKISGSFEICKSLKTIYYGGTKEDWHKVIGSDNEAFSKLDMQCSAPTEKSSSGLSGKGNEIKTEKLSENISCTYNYITEDLVIDGSGELKTNEENWQLSRLLFTAGDPYSDDYTRFVSFKNVVIHDGITKLCCGNFQYDPLESIWIPKSVKSIDENCFGTLSADEDVFLEVYYAGSEADWNKIKIGDMNDELVNGNIHFGAEISEADSATGTPSNTAYILTGASAAVLLIAAAVFLIIRKKKNKNQ